MRIKLTEHDRRIFTPTSYDTPSWRRGYNRRSALERINNRLDQSFGFERHFLRGHAKMQARVGLVAMTRRTTPTRSARSSPPPTPPTIWRASTASSTPAITVNQWTGTGYFQINQTGTSIGAIITGGLSGGEPATATPPAQTVTNQAPLAIPTATPPGGSQSPYGSAASGVNVTGAATPATTDQTGSTGDPVNQVNGNYVYSHDDLSVGSGAFPYGLGFQRSYDSGRRLQSGPLGLGWTDNFLITARTDSDGFEGMGATSPINGAVAIAAIHVIQDLLNAQSSNAKPLDRMVIAAQVQRWLMDHLTGNIVAVTQPESSERFTLLADGTYNPPIGSASALSQSAGAYTYKTKNQVTLDFDSSGNLTSWTHPAGPSVTLTYSGGKLASVTNGMGRTLTFTYSGDRIATVADGTGRSVSYGYDANGNLTSFTDAAGKTTTYAYDIPGRLTQVFYPSKPTNAFVTNTYDSFDRPSTQADANGHTTTLYFTGTRTEIDDPADTAHVTYYSPRGKLLIDIDGLGHQTVNTYDGLDRLASTTRPEGNSVSYTYDDKNNPLTITATPKSGSPLSPSVQTLTYDATYNKVHTAQDANGHTTTYAYDSGTGNLLTLTHPSVGGQTPTEQFTYNGRGQVLTHTDAQGKVTKYTYDASTEARLSVIEDYGSGRLNLTTSYAYDPVGNRTGVTDPNNHTTTKQYDALRRVTQVTAPSPLGYVTSYTYDADGNLLSVVNDPGAAPHLDQTTSYTYTNTFKKASATDPSNHTTSYTYDLLDRLASVTDPENRVTTYAYDALGRLASVTNTAIQSAPLASYTYTANGQKASLTDANGHVTQYSYDGLDRLAQTSYADASTESYSYDAAGNRLGKTTRSGHTIAYTYDALNRLTTRAPQGEPTVTYAYDLTGRVTSVSDTNGAFTYAYDTAGRELSETRPDTKQVAYQYDAAGNRTRVTWPDAYYVSYTFDALNRLSGVLENGTTTLASYDYDAASRRTDLNYGDSSSASYGYAANDDLTSLTQSFTGSSVTFGYGYNGAGQRTSVTVSDGSFLYHPPAASNVSYAPNGVNQYTTVGGASLSHDGNGNLTGDGTASFGYDTENHLVSASALGNTISYAYDPLGRRASKTVNATVTRFVWAGNQTIADYDGAGTLLRRYVYGAGLDEPIVTITVSGATSTKAYNHQDGLGSVVALSDGASGALTDTYAYDPYGQSATLAGNAFRFTGRRLDAESGLYYYRARYYSPSLGRFLQTDPIGTTGGINLYAYVGNDPLNNIDPTGLYTLQLGGTGSIDLPFGFSIPLGGGVAIDTQGHIGLYNYTGIGSEVGASAEVGLSVQVSNAKTISDLRGRSFNVSGHAGEGVGGSIDYFTGNSANGPVTGGGVTLGLAAGASVSGGVTKTLIYAPFGDGSTPVSPSPAAPTQISTQPSSSTPRK